MGDYAKLIMDKQTQSNRNIPIGKHLSNVPVPFSLVEETTYGGLDGGIFLGISHSLGCRK